MYPLSQERYLRQLNSSKKFSPSCTCVDMYTFQLLLGKLHDSHFLNALPNELIPEIKKEPALYSISSQNQWHHTCLLLNSLKFI